MPDISSEGADTGQESRPDADVGLLAAACKLPDRIVQTESVFSDEGAALDPETDRRLGIDAVHACEEETGSELALAAAQQVLDEAGVDATQIDAIVDYTVLPQEYLVPSWSMSNRLQHELGARKAFTVGFSGGGATNLNVALHFGASLIRSDPKVDTVLLLAADVSIPGNRIINRDRPTTVLGDGASALLLQRGAAGCKVLDTELWSDGRYHDVCCVKGGAMAHPLRSDLYRLELDEEAYSAATAMATLRRVTGVLLERARLGWEDVSHFLCPNISAEDHADVGRTLDAEPIGASVRSRHGHMQGNDVVLNFVAAREAGEFRAGDLLWMGSHGMGFLAGATLMRF